MRLVAASSILPALAVPTAIMIAAFIGKATTTIIMAMPRFLRYQSSPGIVLIPLYLLDAVHQLQFETAGPRRWAATD